MEDISVNNREVTWFMLLQKTTWPSKLLRPESTHNTRKIPLCYAEWRSWPFQSWIHDGERGKITKYQSTLNSFQHTKWDLTKCLPCAIGTVLTLGRQDPKLPFQTPEGELRSHNDGFSGTSRVHRPDLKWAEAPLFIITECVTEWTDRWHGSEMEALPWPPNIQLRRAQHLTGHLYTW